MFKELGLDLPNIGSPVNDGLNLLSGAVSIAYKNPGKKVTFAEVVKGTVNSDAKRFTVDWYKLYLDICATYHSAFVSSLLSGVREVKTVLQGNCNAGVSISKEKGYYGLWSFWLNEQGIANLLSIPQLEKDGYVIDYNTKRDRAVTTPEGKVLCLRKTPVRVQECRTLISARIMMRLQ